MYRRRPYGGYGGYGHSRDSGVALAVSLLHQVNQLEHKPPATMLLLAINVLAFFAPDTVPSIGQACINPSMMRAPASFLFRSFAAAFTHADMIHLYANMTSLIYKGYLLERRGRYSAYSLVMLVLELVLTSSLLYCVVATLFPVLHLWRSCAVGFSAVLFGLKVVLHDCEAREGVGERFQTASWLELLLGQFISSQYGGMTTMGSAVGHGCGVLAGIIHVNITKPILHSM